MKLKIMYSDKQLQEIRFHARKCMMELGPMKLDDTSDLYPLVAIASGESDKLRFTKSVVLITQEFTISSNPELFPTIHLYGPENLGNYEIIKCHPSIRSPSGQGIDALQKQEINLHLRSNIEDIVRINESYKEYLIYLKNVFKITNSLLTDDLINICYDSVLNRAISNGSHNILNNDEALSDIVLTSICRNALRMMRDKNYKPNRFIPAHETKYLNNITNPCNDIECLKDGSLNNITTFLAIYTLNALEYPSTLDHLCLTLSTRYQHKFEAFNKYIGENYNNISEYNDLRVRKPDLAHIRNTLKFEKEVNDIRKKVNQTVGQSIAELKKDKLIISQGKKILPNADSLMIKTNSGFKEVIMPPIEKIRRRRKNIQNFNSYLKRKRSEWKTT